MPRLQTMVEHRHIRRNVAALLLGSCVLTFAAAGPGVPDWHGVRARLADVAARLGLGPANAQPRPTLIPIKATAGFVEAPPAQALRPVTPEEAVLWNASVPLSPLLNRPAPAFRLAASATVDNQRALDCLTATIYYEAGSESLQGQRAVAQVVLNRVRHPAYPKTVCGVSFQGAELPTSCQFTYTCDGSLARSPSADGWSRARKVAEAALAGYVEPSVGGATHYHTIWVVPYWQSEVAKVAVIGAHIFYRWDGGWTNPRYAGSYVGDEPDVARIYGVGAAPFAAARIQLAVLEAPVPMAPPPVEVVEIAPIDHSHAMAPAAPTESLPAVEIAALAGGVEKPTGVVGEIRKNRQVPLPGGW